MAAQALRLLPGPIVICVLGQSPFGTTLEDTIRGEVVRGRTFRVRQVAVVQPPGECQMLFVNSSERKQFRSVVGLLKGAGVLSVGEAEGFTADGGVITLKLDHRSVRLEINVTAAEYSGIQISA